MSEAGEIIDVAFKGDLDGFRLDVAFAAPARGVTALFGPSGCGKTSTLRCMAGLQRLPGRCVVAGEVWQDDKLFLPPHRRPIGFVFQEASLFAHMSVRGNLLFSHAGRNRATVRPGAVAFDDVVDLLGLAGLIDRSPGGLSGGERQRVAIGRALLSDPRLLLMDEPLSALDRDRREEIMPFLERLHASLSLPILLVTHEMSTMERLADHLILIDGGRIVASGSLADIQSDPGLPLAARRDSAVSLEGVVVDVDPAYGIASVDVAGGVFRIPAPEGGYVGSHLRLQVAAGDISLAREKPGATTILNVLPARIIAARGSGEHEIIAVLQLGETGGGVRMLARVTRLSWERLALGEGMSVYAQVKSIALARQR